MDDLGNLDLQIIARDDSRFSRLIVDNLGKNAIIKKSQIFDKYYKVDANDKALYKIGIILNGFYQGLYESKNRIINFLNDESDDRWYFRSIAKKDDLIYLESQYDQATKSHSYNYPITKENFKNIISEWEMLLNSGVEKAKLSYVDDRVILLKC